MGYLLFILALILSIFLYPIGLLYSLIKLIALFKLKKALKHLNDIFFNVCYISGYYGQRVYETLI
jgi:hypothetical protein